MGTASQQEKIHRHSGWLIPAILFFTLLLLSGLLLGWYLRPGPKPSAAPTGQSHLVKMTVRGVPLSIPANYLESSVASGALEAVNLAVLFPSWQGYSKTEAPLFLGNPPDAPVIRLALRGDASGLDGRERLNRIYLPHVTDPQGAKAAFGLTQYVFAENSGYDGSELFAGESGSGLVLLLCERASADFSSPNCLVVDRPLAAKLSFSYHFKRAYLARWKEIDTGVKDLLAKFRAP